MEGSGVGDGECALQAALSWGSTSWSRNRSARGVRVDPKKKLDNIGSTCGGVTTEELCGIRLCQDGMER